MQRNYAEWKGLGNTLVSLGGRKRIDFLGGLGAGQVEMVVGISGGNKEGR